MDGSEWPVYVTIIATVVVGALIMSILKCFSQTMADNEDESPEIEMPNALGTQIDIVIDAPWPKLPCNWPRCLEASGGILYDTVSPSPEEVGGCTVCLDGYGHGDHRATIAACRHSFHAACIEKWLEENYTCPLCRHNLL